MKEPVLQGNWRVNGLHSLGDCVIQFMYIVVFSASPVKKVEAPKANGFSNELAHVSLIDYEVT